MLILIAGITGNIGQYAARHALATGHQVRGLGRSPAKLDQKIGDQLESFIISTAYYDIFALEKAVSGVDAVICAYAGLPELHLDGQLALIRATERAGVRRYLAASWNYDWRKVPFGSEPFYDPARMFHAQLAITSTPDSIRPLHIFSGMLAEVFFGVEGQTGFTPADNGVWDPVAKSMDIWGSGDEPWQFTTEEDAGKWGVELVTSKEAEEGGFVNFCSFQASPNELRKLYEHLRGRTVQVKHRGSVEELENIGEALKTKLGPEGFWDWHRYIFHANCIKGVWNFDGLANDRFPRVTATSAEQFFKDHPEV